MISDDSKNEFAPPGIIAKPVIINQVSAVPNTAVRSAIHGNARTTANSIHAIENDNDISNLLLIERYTYTSFSL